MRYDGIEVLRGLVTPPANACCINADLTVVAWSRERGIYEVGRGTDHDSARAIARLHSGHDDYIDFDGGVEILFTPTKGDA